MGQAKDIIGNKDCSMVSLSNHADHIGKSVSLIASFDKLRMLLVISDNVYCLF